MKPFKPNKRVLFLVILLFFLTTIPIPVKISKKTTAIYSSEHGQKKCNISIDGWKFTHLFFPAEIDVTISISADTSNAFDSSIYTIHTNQKPITQNSKEIYQAGDARYNPLNNTSVVAFIYFDTNFDRVVIVELLSDTEKRIYFAFSENYTLKDVKDYYSNYLSHLFQK